MKLQFNLLDRYILMGTYESVRKEGTMKELACIAALDGALGITLDEYKDFEIEQSEEGLKWNEKGREKIEKNVHPLAVGFLVDKISEKMEGKMVTEQMVVFFDVMKQIHHSEDKMTLEESTIEKLDAKMKEIAELESIFNGK